jgi:hypothetical protein
VTEKNVNNDEPTQEQIEHRINQIAEDSGFIMDFQVGLKLSQEEIDADEVRAHITESVYQHIVMLSKQYPCITLDYRFYHGLRNYIPIPVIED